MNKELEQRLMEIVKNAPATTTALLDLVEEKCQSPVEAALCLMVAAHSLARAHGIPFPALVQIVTRAAPDGKVQ